MKVAFASTDKVHIDEHFGKAEEFYIWDIGPEEAAFSGVAQLKAEEGYIDDKIEARTSVLADCALVYVGEIGGPLQRVWCRRRFTRSRAKIMNRSL